MRVTALTPLMLPSGLVPVGGTADLAADDAARLAAAGAVEIVRVEEVPVVPSDTKSRRRI